jgi:hypothetical protein
MSAGEFTDRLAKTNEEIKRLTSGLEAAKASKIQWLTEGKPAKGVQALNDQLRIGQEHLEDLAITKAALEGKLRVYAQNQTKAVKLREEVKLTWDEARSLIGLIAKHQEDVSNLLEKINALEAKIRGNARKHLELVGEQMNEPGSIAIYQALAFAGSSVERIKPYPAWTFVSENERRERVAMIEAGQIKLQEKRAEIAQAHAPLCPDCGNPMTLNRSGGRKEDLGEVFHLRGKWIFEHCNTALTQTIPETKEVPIH